MFAQAEILASWGVTRVPIYVYSHVNYVKGWGFCVGGLVATVFSKVVNFTQLSGMFVPLQICRGDFSLFCSTLKGDI